MSYMPIRTLSQIFFAYTNFIFYYKTLPQKMTLTVGGQDMKSKITSKMKRIDVLPLVKHYITELGLYELFENHIPKQPNATMEPAWGDENHPA